MVNAPERYREAERFAAEADEWLNADYGWKVSLTAEERRAYRAGDLAAAQVHATLALAATGLDAVERLRSDVAVATDRLAEMEDVFRETLRRVDALEAEHAADVVRERWALRDAADKAAVDDYEPSVTDECGRRWHEKCPPDTACDCYCHPDDSRMHGVVSYDGPQGSLR